MSNDSSEQLRIASDGVLQRVGRNVLIFQRIEGNLKTLVANRSVSGPMGRFVSLWQEQIVRAQRKTFGTLAGDYGKNEAPPDPPDDVALVEPHFSIHFGPVQWFDKSHKLSEADLKSLVESRNVLAHLFLEQYSLESLQQCEHAAAWLDEQYAQATQLLHLLRFECETLRQGWSSYVAFVQSPDFNDEFERAWLRESRLIHAFGHAFKRLQRTDGWAVFATAASHVRAEQPEEVAELKPRYGHKTLKALILASRLFETREEATSRGGIRLLFRINPDWSFEPAAEAQAPAPDP